jgi:hypothetical protein
VEKHLLDVGLLDRAPLYYENSVKWQKELRKACFELVRLSDTFAGYDFLGDIDTHWHTFGYCVGMMNEFYELKPGETVENVRRYNSDTVLLADLGKTVNYRSGDVIDLPVFISNYGKAIANSTVKITLTDGACEIFKYETKIPVVESGKLSEIYRINFKLPDYTSATEIKLSTKLYCDGTVLENEWSVYAFPAPKKLSKHEYQFTGH